MKPEETRNTTQPNGSAPPVHSVAVDSLQQTVEMGRLLDFYGDLLTPRQCIVMHQYFEENLSLAEIADSASVSRAAVHDQLHRAENTLRTYEEKLHLVANDLRRRQLLAEVTSLLQASLAGTALSRTDQEVCARKDELVRQALRLLTRMRETG